MMFLLYDGNIYLYNIYTLIIVLIFVVNELLLKKEELLIQFEMSTNSIRKYKKFRIVVLVIFIVVTSILFIRFINEEVFAGWGSV